MPVEASMPQEIQWVITFQFLEHRTCARLCWKCLQLLSHAIITSKVYSLCYPCLTDKKMKTLRVSKSLSGKWKTHDLNSGCLVLGLTGLTIALLSIVASLPSHEISAASDSRCGEGWGVEKSGVWGKGFVVFFSWALLLPASMQVASVFHQVIYVGNSFWHNFHRDYPLKIDFRISGRCHARQFTHRTSIY